MRSELRNITVEDRLRSYLDKEAKLFADNPILSRFYSWQKQMLQSVKVEPTNEIVGVRQLIDHAGLSNHFEAKRCYDNALQLTIASLGEQETNYVEGFVVVNEHMLFGHAWNSKGGQYFDHTTELMNALLVERGVALPTQHFFKVIELPLRDVYAHSISEDETSIQVLHFLKQNGLKLSDLKVGWDLIPNAEHLP